MYSLILCKPLQDYDYMQKKKKNLQNNFFNARTKVPIV
jgi:hypothetical protein